MLSRQRYNLKKNNNVKSNVDMMSNTIISNSPSSRRTTNTALHIFSWQGIKQNFQPPPSSDILIFISIRAVQTDRRGKMRFELGWWISSSLPDLKQDIFPIQLFWSSNLHLISPPHKVEIQGRTKKPKSPELYFDRSMNPTEQQGLVFYHRICWHWHLIFILFSLSFILFGDAHGILEGWAWKC